MLRDGLPRFISGEAGTREAQGIGRSPPCAATATNRSIPRRLVFTYITNLLLPEYLSRDDKEGNLARNVRRTIRMYCDAWNGTISSNGTQCDSVPIDYYTDQDCLQLLQEVEPRLVSPFQNETFGAYKSDICRAAALYKTGGHYHDNDLVTVQVPTLADYVEFSAPTVGEYNLEYFQAYFAVATVHPIIKHTLEAMVEVYEKRLQIHSHMGTCTMREGFVRYRREYPDENPAKIRFLHEHCLAPEPKFMPDHPRDGNGCYPSNRVVYDMESHSIVFEARITPAVMEKYHLGLNTSA